MDDSPESGTCVFGFVVEARTLKDGGNGIGFPFRNIVELFICVGVLLALRRFGQNICCFSLKLSLSVSIGSKISVALFLLAGVLWLSRKDVVGQYGFVFERS